VKKNPRPNFSNAGTAASARGADDSDERAQHEQREEHRRALEQPVLPWRRAAVAGGGVGLRRASESIEAVIAGGIGAVAVDIITPAKKKGREGELAAERAFFRRAKKRGVEGAVRSGECASQDRLAGLSLELRLPRVRNNLDDTVRHGT
jgi:hypothetical protein